MAKTKYRSLSELARLSGKDIRTVRKILDEFDLEAQKGPHGAQLYDAPRALEVLFTGRQVQFDLAQEKARLTRSQANRSELEEQQLTGELIPAAEVKRWLDNLVLNCRAHFLALPNRLANVALAATTLHEIETRVREEIHTALDELADTGPAMFLDSPDDEAA